MRAQGQRATRERRQQRAHAEPLGWHQGEKRAVGKGVTGPGLLERAERRRWATAGLVGPGRGRMTWAELGWAVSGLGWPTGYWAAWVDLLLLLFFLFSFSSQLKTI